MDITCERCRRSCFVPDDLVQGRRFRATCSECDHAFAVDVSAGAAGGQAAPADALAAKPTAAKPGREILRWADEGGAAARATAGGKKPIVLKGQPSRRRSASGLGVAVGAVVLLAAMAGLALWMNDRSRFSDGGSRLRVVTVAESVADPVGDAGGVAVATPPTSGAVSPAPTPIPIAVPPAAAIPTAIANPTSPAVPSTTAIPKTVALSAANATEPASTAPAAASRPKRKRRLPSERQHAVLLGRRGDATPARAAGDAAARSARSAPAPTAAAKVVARNRRAFDACVSRALRRGPSVAPGLRATLVLTVQPDGRVTDAFILEQAVERSDLGACLAEAARRMLFPAFEGDAVEMAMPLSLTAPY